MDDDKGKREIARKRSEKLKELEMIELLKAFVRVYEALKIMEINSIKILDLKPVA